MCSSQRGIGCATEVEQFSCWEYRLPREKKNNKFKREDLVLSPRDNEIKIVVAEDRSQHPKTASGYDYLRERGVSN